MGAQPRIAARMSVAIIGHNWPADCPFCVPKKKAFLRTLASCETDQTPDTRSSHGDDVREMSFGKRFLVDAPRGIAQLAGVGTAAGGVECVRQRRGCE